MRKLAISFNSFNSIETDGNFSHQNQVTQISFEIQKSAVGATENSPIHFGHLDISDRTYTIGFLESLTLIPF